MSISAAPRGNFSARLPRLTRGTKAYDLLAAAPVAVWFGLNAASVLQVLAEKTRLFLAHPDMTIGLTILSRAGVLLFALAAIGMLLMRSPPSAGARGIGPRIASLLGTYVSVAIALLPATPVPNFVLALSAILILGGTAFSVYSILFLGRSFSIIAEARQLVTDGPYARIRHPLYVGEEVAVLGATIQYISPLALGLLALQIACQFYRMECEETVLEEAFPEYGAYKARTARLIPGIY